MATHFTHLDGYTPKEMQNVQVSEVASLSLNSDSQTEKTGNYEEWKLTKLSRNQKDIKKSAAILTTLTR